MATKTAGSIVICYDDREITLDGKKVVGPDWRHLSRHGRMHDALGKDFELTDSIHEPFQETTGLDGRIHFYMHPNPQNKILHTVLVGEMNGLVHVATLGTPLEEKWGKFGGPRAYTKFVQPEPTPAEKTSPAGGRVTTTSPPNPRSQICRTGQPMPSAAQSSSKKSRRSRSKTRGRDSS